MGTPSVFAICRRVHHIGCVRCTPSISICVRLQHPLPLRQSSLESKPDERGNIQMDWVFKVSAMALWDNSCISSTRSSQLVSHRLWLGCTVHNCFVRKPFSSHSDTLSAGTVFIPLYNVQSEIKCPLSIRETRPGMKKSFRCVPSYGNDDRFERRSDAPASDLRMKDRYASQPIIPHRPAFAVCAHMKQMARPSQGN